MTRINRGTTFPPSPGDPAPVEVPPGLGVVSLPTLCPQSHRGPQESSLDPGECVPHRSRRQPPSPHHSCHHPGGDQASGFILTSSRAAASTDHHNPQPTSISPQPPHQLLSITATAKLKRFEGEREREGQAEAACPPALDETGKDQRKHTETPFLPSSLLESSGCPSPVILNSFQQRNQRASHLIPGYALLNLYGCLSIPVHWSIHSE